MEKDKKSHISVIMPAFNAANHIEETIASVRSQTYPDWELLIANDGSTDDTVPIIEKAARSDSRIKLLNVEGRTGLPSRARNLAMAHASGDVFAFLDADDLWTPDKLDRQLTYLDEHDEADGVCCWFDTFGDPYRVRNEIYRMKTKSICNLSELIDGMPFYTPTLMFRRYCYDGIGGMNEDPRLRMGEDAEYFARLLKDFQIHRIREVMVHVRLSPIDKASLSVSMINEHNDIGWRITEIYEEKNLLPQSALKRRRSYLYYERARINMRMLKRPFRADLLKSVLMGYSSWQAKLTLLLCFLPRPLLSALLMGMQRSLNCIKRHHYNNDVTDKSR